MVKSVVPRVSKQSAHHSHKLASVGEMAAGLMHELKNPLTSISFIAEYMLSSADDEKGRETAIIKVDPGTIFPNDSLNQREEIFVLEGSLSDEHGDYHAVSHGVGKE